MYPLLSLMVITTPTITDILNSFFYNYKDWLFLSCIHFSAFCAFPPNAQILQNIFVKGSIFVFFYTIYLFVNAFFDLFLKQVCSDLAQTHIANIESIYFHSTSLMYLKNTKNTECFLHSQ